MYIHFNVWFMYWLTVMVIYEILDAVSPLSPLRLTIIDNWLLGTMLLSLIWVGSKLLNVLCDRFPRRGKVIILIIYLYLNIYIYIYYNE